ncbi:MAG: twin-arginine translocase TatA/TatE family subunit [Acidiphilium sp.]|jgi:sec-independent protein translocase protein TatA|uniref:Sec-independent protein translocase protein TatA n=1 Tax=Acidiphilium acidophilum TaxID=76588 RepID=A0AAW9DQI4_ACIAO|nr:twin-arginine translocase TatA/TatE family subunit [Acidiphilium acidophilum]MDD2861452.1 twin-arginine translocase TatA/TatE family subunit [Acidiphilium sp.]MDX5931376.1 twin-arginine translocase TatA/TatE family subunit [Acidiphilium acidophilum]MEE3502164.1 twin-arginine translocase TatA/TatE family subunit [Acidiphilium acidophilum]GBR77293.1 twin arginine-targeting protein translocase [Acidiphilium acidophilum DSM 700]
MGFDSPIHWIIVIGVIALLFGGSRVGNLMGELGKGIKAFKQNVSDHDQTKVAPAPVAPPPQVQTRVAEGVPPADAVVRQPEPVHVADSNRL